MALKEQNHKFNINVLPFESCHFVPKLPKNLILSTLLISVAFYFIQKKTRTRVSLGGNKFANKYPSQYCQINLLKNRFPQLLIPEMETALLTSRSVSRSPGVSVLESARLS